MGTIDPKLIQRYAELANDTIRETLADPFYQMVDDVPTQSSRVGWKHVNEQYMENVVRAMAEGIQIKLKEAFWSQAEVSKEPFALAPGHYFCSGDDDLLEWAMQQRYEIYDATPFIPMRHVGVFEGMPAAEVTATCKASEEDGMLVLDFAAGIRPLHPIRLYRIYPSQRRRAKKRKQIG